jgi:hypothetical protein
VVSGMEKVRRGKVRDEFLNLFLSLYHVGKEEFEIKTI